MKVVYIDPDGRAGTFHPRLGYLKSGEVFELPAEDAEEYISAGILSEKKAKGRGAGRKTKKNNGAEKQTKKKLNQMEVMNDGKSIDGQGNSDRTEKSDHLAHAGRGRGE